MRRPAVVCCLLFILVASVSSEFNPRNADDFKHFSEVCFKKLKVPQSYKAKFNEFDYPDEPIVHMYLRCIWVHMELWNDKTGFDVEHLANVYKDSANTEVLIPILSQCNQNTRNEPPLKWLYRAFKCVLESPVGDWFKNVVRKADK